MMITLALIAAAAAAWTLAYHRASGLAWSLAFAAAAAALTYFTSAPTAAIAAAWIAVAIFAALSVVKPLRRAVVTSPVFGIYKKILPQVSQTEQEALDAGSIWWDADLFTGKPDWKKLLAYPQAKLSAEERAFIDGPVEELCGCSTSGTSSTTAWTCRRRCGSSSARRASSASSSRSRTAGSASPPTRTPRSSPRSRRAAARRR
jgi:hypothetical protein